jgi:hypothetical protein
MHITPPPSQIDFFFVILLMAINLYNCDDIDLNLNQLLKKDKYNFLRT